MAVLVDSLGNLDHSVRRKFKKVFARLSEDYVVRTPAQDSVRIADLIIEGRGNRWLLLGCHQTRPTAEELEKYLSFSLALTGIDNSQLNYLAITETGDSLFDVPDDRLESVINVERDAFFSDGADVITNNIRSVSVLGHEWLKKTIFPETNINPACTTRRESVVRDNTARLQSFFLDYDQEAATKLDMIGDPHGLDGDEADDYFVRLINGVAGCGKTLILINRAILYCNKFPDREVLLLIHNKPITSDIEYKFDKYLAGKPDNLAIKTFHAFALGQKSLVNGSVKPLFTQKNLKPYLEKILTAENPTRAQLNLSDEQVWSEIEYINDFLIEDEQAYSEIDRQGRGFSLLKSQRELIWQLYKQLMALVSSRKGYLPSLYIRELCLAPAIDNRLQKFDHILLDEAQFFYPSWLQLVLRSLNVNGQLFMCADPNQGFLKSRLSWKSVGLNVRGRTKKLSYSYRTTYEILVAANALLEHLDDDPEEFIKPDLVNMARGSRPRVIYTDTPQDELKRFLNELKELVRNAGLPLHQIMVLCSDSKKTWSLQRSMEGKLGRHTVVNCNDRTDLEENLGERIRLMSINSCTGMEAGITLVLGVGDIINAENNLDLSSEEKEIQHQESIRKLYVAMTRAGQKLLLFSTVRMPDYMEKYLDVG